MKEFTSAPTRLHTAYSLFLIGLFLAIMPVAADEPDLPAGVSADWWNQVEYSIRLEEYAIREEGGETFRAPNHAHRFESRFNREGLTLEPTDGSPWKWSLSLAAWGRPDALQTANAGLPSFTENRMELGRGALTEWFVNGPEGIEHGFTIPVPPPETGDRLVFDIALAGGLRPVFAGDGQAIDFFGAGNVSVLRYAKLVVTDAVGTALPSHMEPINGGIRIVVDDSRAVYPVIVDPLATTPTWTVEGEGYQSNLGWSVSTAGDVNGDGYSDVVVGAYGFETGTGKAYLYLGGSGGLSPVPAWTALGEAILDYFGSSVATAGDVNGDGYSDVLVGAFDNDESFYDAGKVYLYLGNTAGLSESPAWTATGEADFDSFGSAVATAGDVNGDGYSDVVVGASNHSNAGKVYLYLGGVSGLPPTASWTASGEAYGDYFGGSVATAGDVNGDGYSDLIVAAPGIHKAHLYHGGPGGLSATPSWTSTGEGPPFGSTVATAGDVNGDGYADVVIGASSWSNNTGRAYLYQGGPGGLSTTASWSATGAGEGFRFGKSVATAGDVNGDGYSDIIIGAYSSPGGGEVHLYLGGSGGLPATAAWSAWGESSNHRFGYSVAPAGDTNGDGFSDVLVGASMYSGTVIQTGKAYLYLGGTYDLVQDPGWTGSGGAGTDYSGYSVASAGDVNGDGYSDLVIGAYGNDTNGFNAGKAYLHLGGPDGPVAGASWTAFGETEGDNFGQLVASAGDVNGDGYSDLLVGAPNADANGNYVGKVYLYLGGPYGTQGSAAWSATGEAADNYFGRSAASAGDVNNDGYSDVVVGAYLNDENGTDAGKVYLYLGGPGGLASDPAWTYTGIAAGDSFGRSVSTAGDVNGDGYSDVIIGAYLNDENGSSAGKAYLFVGQSNGLSAGAWWAVSGESADNRFGFSVSTAGDVNGDGYSDVIIGAYGKYSYGGQAYLYTGGAGGLSPTPSWTRAGQYSSDRFGYSVATAGDVNGDGYSDVVIGAYLNDGNGNAAGKAYLYTGGATGLTDDSTWETWGEYELDYFGHAVATAGDVNGDGLSDVLIGAYGNDESSSLAGKVYLYYGGGTDGQASVPRQLRTDGSAPIHPGNPAYEQQFRLGLTLRSPVGAVLRQLQWQVVLWPGNFSLGMNPVQNDTTWYQSPVACSKRIDLPVDMQRYVWRARVWYKPSQSPFVPWSRWFTISGNALHEADLLSNSQPEPPPCQVPDEPTYITTITTDGNGKPVIHYQDPNQPDAVTGYNIHRASSPAGPWTRIGSNVVDMDETTPDIQYVDQAGDVGGPWYYKVAAWNEVCGVEGPW